MRTDWRGQTYDVGDTIVYPRGLGGSGCEMVVAKVLELRDNGNVVVEPLTSSSIKWGTQTSKHAAKRVTLTKVINITVPSKAEPF